MHGRSIGPEAILALAPERVPSYRRKRYGGDGQGLTLAAVPQPERDLVVSLYEILGELQGVLASQPASVETRASYRSRLFDALSGMRFAGNHLTEQLAQALHDVRGGALTALLFRLDERRSGDGDEALSVLVRDQRKIIRNVIEDVDRAARERDAQRRPHSLKDLASAARNVEGSSQRGRVAVRITKEREAVVAESCLEFAALDRAVYNLLNNAVRHTAGETVDLWLTVLPADVRVVVGNPVLDRQRDILSSVLAHHPAGIYADFSTTGSGLGLGIVAEVVGAAYGVSDAEELVEAGHIGARLFEDFFVTWLHWPLAAPDGEP